MSVEIPTRLFGKTKQGEDVLAYTLKNKNGLQAEVMTFGANLLKLIVPDKNEKFEDVTLGYDTLQPYYDNPCFFGATVGPSANRIAKAQFTIDGKFYKLKVNDNDNNLHSDEINGYHKQLWKANIKDAQTIEFTLKDNDGHMGFPGNKDISVTYNLNDNNELKISYDVKSDKNTLINMSNHSYFNLAGNGNGTILDHYLLLKASNFTPILKGLIPTGKIAPVAGTVFDFTKERKLGERINTNEENLNIAGGYDHNWCLDDFKEGTVRLVGYLRDEKSGRKMEIYTDRPGIQIYAGNFIAKQVAKNGANYDVRSGVAIETQNYPNAINEPNFPNAVYGPNREFKSTTIYKFV